jgi:hypothetical protein
MVLLDGFLDGFSKFGFFIVEICILIRDFWVIFENYCMRMLSIRGNDFYRMLSILGTDFIAHWAYEERISAHAQPAVKCELFYMYNLCWAYAERILSHTEHTRNECHRMLIILGTDFIACWACAEMFKSQISLPIRKRFLKISCYRPLGPYGFGFCKKSQKKLSCLCTFKKSGILILCPRCGLGPCTSFGLNCFLIVDYTCVQAME